MMQPGYNPTQPSQGHGFSSYPPQSSTYNYDYSGTANAPIYNGGGDVTYAQSGLLQTTKQIPPATSGSMPTQQPPAAFHNGYHYNVNNYQQPYQPQQPSFYNYSQHPSTAPTVPTNTLAPPTQYQLQQHANQQPPTQFGPPPTVMPPNQGSRYPPPHVQGPQAGLTQPPTSQFQGMQISGPSSAPYVHPAASGMPSSPSPPGITPPVAPPMGTTPQMDGSAQMGQPQPGLSGPPGMRPYPNQNANQSKRLDPDTIPSPIQVIENDKKSSSEVFRTEGRGLLPPLVTTRFRVEDMGSASPRFIRCTTYNLPATADMAKMCQIPMGLVVKPLARLPDGEAPPLIVDPGPDGPIRCKRCKAYMCPQFSFTDGGRRFQCVLCNAITETPHNYFDHIDHMNQRVDKYRRPELCRGSYEFLATKDYCRNDKFPSPPAFIFAIDVSYNAIKSGYVDLLCQQLRTLLDTLPKDINQEKSTIRVGFITYNSVLHFYNLRSSLAQPQMMVVSDVNDVFIPLQDGFLVNVDESRHVIDSLLQQIPDMFRDTRETDLVFAPVIQATVQALQSADCAGKLFMFHTTLPIGDAPGKLKNRDDRKLIGTDKEISLFLPASNFYEKLGKECTAQGLCVDLFLFPNQYVDVATLSQIPMYTGGQLYKYNFFRAEVDAEQFIQDLTHDLQRDIVFDAVMRVRTSTGVRAVEFVGALCMNNTTDVELAAVDCDKSILVELKHDDKIKEEHGAFVQVALLYTSVGGQRRLRLHNLNLSVCTQPSDLYRHCETDVLINYLARKCIKAGSSYTSAKIRETLISQASNILAMYRKHVAAPSSPGQLILPECMKLLPVYLNCLLKNDAIHSSHDISTDDRAFLRNVILSMDVSETQLFFYPTLLPVISPEVYDDDSMPVAIRCSEERMREDEAYFLVNGVNMFLWLGQAIDPAWIHNVFGVQSAAQIDIDSGKLFVFDNDDSRKIRDLVTMLQADKTRYMKLTVVRQKDKLEPWFKHFLVEDRGAAGAASYVDFLCHMHKEIRNLLS